MSLQVDSFLHDDTETYTHVLHSEQGSAAAIIDPVLDYDAASGRTSTTSAETVWQHVQQLQLDVQWIIETHAHADHLSAAPYLRDQINATGRGSQVAIGRPITDVQGLFKPVFNLEAGFATDGSQFDHLFQAGDQFQLGDLTLEVLAVPGHTPADMAYVATDGGQTAIFVGDSIFAPDVGTARCDFPGGNAHDLYRSIQKLLAYPDDTRLYLCHDYPPKPDNPAAERRPHQAYTTVAASRQHNIHVRDGISEDEFVSMRQKRDATLSMPRLILPSIQVNIRAGQLPPPEEDGKRYLKIPLNAL